MRRFDWRGIDWRTCLGLLVLDGIIIGLSIVGGVWK